MKRALLTLLPAFVLSVPSALALDDECADFRHLAALYEVRAIMLRPYSSSYDVERAIDRRLDQLRGPTGDGEYRWVRWVRPSDDGPTDKQGHNVVAVQGRDVDRVEKSSHHAYAVRIAVPRKRSLLNSNNPVWVGDVRVNYEVEGRRRTKTESINAFLNPDTSRTIDLGAIAERVDVSLDAATAQRHVKEALVEVQFRQALMQDDPANPAYDAIQSLRSLRSSPTPYELDTEIARLERTLFPDANPLPLLGVIADLRRADELMRSSKDDDKDKGERLLKETLRRLR